MPSAATCSTPSARRASWHPRSCPRAGRQRSWATQKAVRQRPGPRSCTASYAPELELAGVAAGAAAADVELAGPTLDGSFFSFFLAYGAIGYAAAYPELELEPYLVGVAGETIDALRRTNVLQAAVRGPALCARRR